MMAMAEADRLELRRGVVVVIRHKRADALAGVPDAYVDNLVALALSTCASHGFDEHGHVIEFADALVKDDAHPLSPTALDAKAVRVLREFRARSVFTRLRDIAAATAAASNQEP
jgi:hypothetical protein